MGKFNGAILQTGKPEGGNRVNCCKAATLHSQRQIDCGRNGRTQSIGCEPIIVARQSVKADETSKLIKTAKERGGKGVFAVKAD